MNDQAALGGAGNESFMPNYDIDPTKLIIDEQRHQVLDQDDLFPINKEFAYTFLDEQESESTLRPVDYLKKSPLQYTLVVEMFRALFQIVNPL